MAIGEITFRNLEGRTWLHWHYTILRLRLCGTEHRALSNHFLRLLPSLPARRMGKSNEHYRPRYVLVPSKHRVLDTRML